MLTSSSDVLQRCVVIIPAAGHGRRMGMPKALMTIDGEVWWQAQMRGLPCELRVVMVVPDKRAGEFQSRGREATFVPAASDAPMMASLVAGLRAVMTGLQALCSTPDARDPHGIFVLPIDTPAPRQAVWTRLAVEHTPACPATVDDRGCEVRGHPVFLPWGWVMTTLAPLLEDEQAAETARLDHLLEGWRVAVRIDDPLAYLNMNTPADVEAYLALRRSDA